MEVGGVEEQPLSDCDSDRTVVEGSVVESDYEDDELHLKRLIFINKGECRANAVTGKGIDGAIPSPEFQLICKMNKRWKDSQNKQELMNQGLPDMSESPERSLLTGAIITVSKTTTENHEQLMLEEVPVQNMFADFKTKPQTPETPEVTFRKIAARVNDTDTTVISSDFILTKTPAKKKTAAENGEIQLSDLLKPLSDSESPKMTLSLEDLVVFQDRITSGDKSAVENTVLPTELLTALNALSETPDLVLPMERNGPENIDVRCFSPELSNSPLDDDSTQSFNDQDKSELVISTHQITSSPNQQNRKGLNAVVINSCMKTNGETSMCLKNVESKKRRDVESSHRNVERMTAQKNGWDSNESVHPATKEAKEESKCAEHENNYSVDFCGEDNGSEKCSNLRCQSAKNSCKRSVLDVSNIKPIRRSSRIAVTERNSKPTVKPLNAASVNRRNMMGETQLHKAVMKDNTCLVRALIKAGANVNVQDYAGWAPLHEASFKGFYNTANELLKAGADVNLGGFEQETPIRDAVRGGHYEVADLLLRFGADPLLRGGNGKCALDEAKDENLRSLLLSFIPESNQSLLSGKKSKSCQELQKTKEKTHSNISADTMLEASLCNKDTLSGDGSDPLVSKQRRDSTEQNRNEDSLVNKGTGHVLRKMPNRRACSEEHANDVRLNPIRIKSDIVKHPHDKDENGIILNLQIGSSNQPLTVPQKQKVSLCDKTTCTVILNDDSSSECNTRLTSLNKNRTPLPEINNTSLHQVIAATEASDTSTVVPLSEVSAVLPPELSPQKKVTVTLLHKASATHLNELSATPLLEVSSPQHHEVLSHLHHQINKASPDTVSVPPPREVRAAALHEVHEALSHRGNITLDTDHAILDAEDVIPPHESFPCHTRIEYPTPQQEVCNSLRHRDYTAYSMNFEQNHKDLSKEPNYHTLEMISDSKKSLQPTEMEKCIDSVGKTNIGCPDERSMFLKQNRQSEIRENSIDMDGLNDNEKCSERQKNPPNEFLSNSVLISQNLTKSVSVTDFQEQNSNCIIQHCKHNANELSLQQPATSLGIVFEQYGNLDSVKVPTFCSQESESLTDSDCTIIFEHGSVNAESDVHSMVSKDLGDCTEETSQASTEAHISCNSSLSITGVTFPESIVHTNTDNAKSQTDGWTACEKSGEKSLLACATDEIEKETKKSYNHTKTIQPCENDPVTSKRNGAGQQISSHHVRRKSSGNPCQPQFNQMDRKTCKKSDFSISGKQLRTSVSDNPVPGVVAGLKKRNYKGETHLHLAAKKGDVALVKALITAGINVNQKDYAGWTAIHEASCRGFSEVISELLTAGADVNCLSLDGIMPIHDAVSNNHFKVVEVLLQHGANPSVKDKHWKGILDYVCDDKMRELLKPYFCALENAAVCKQSEKNMEAEPIQSRLSVPDNCDNYKAPNLPSSSHQYATREKVGKHQTIICILQNIEERQKRLFLSDLQTQKDADLYIQEMAQIQNVLNDVLVKQKAEKDVLAKKYRSSVDSFKQGRLREELAKLASRQRNLLNVVQKQKELSQKIKDYSNKNKRRARTANKLIAISEEPYEELHQFQASSLSEGRTAEEENVSSSTPDNAHISEGKVSKCSCESTLQAKLPIDTAEASFTSNPATCDDGTEYSHKETNNALEFTAQVTKQNPTPIKRTFSISDARILNVDTNLHQSLNECQKFISVGQNLQKNANMDEASLQLHTEHPATATISLCAVQKNNCSQKAPLLNANQQHEGPFGVANPQIMSHVLQGPEPQSSKTTLFPGWTKRKCKMIDLIKVGKLKPGEDVLEFKIQDSSHKATLLWDGRIRINSGRIYSNPVQWIRTLLGNDISVSWKYVLKKVSYLGKELSSYISDEACAPKESALPYQQKQNLAESSSLLTEVHAPLENITSVPVPQHEQAESPSLLTEAQAPLENIISVPVPQHEQESSSPPDPVATSTHYLQLKDVVLISNREFLPCHIMDKYWKYYMECKDFGF